MWVLAVTCGRWMRWRDSRAVGIKTPDSSLDPVQSYAVLQLYRGGQCKFFFLLFFFCHTFLFLHLCVSLHSSLWNGHRIHWLNSISVFLSLAHIFFLFSFLETVLLINEVCFWKEMCNLEVLWLKRPKQNYLNATSTETNARNLKDLSSVLTILFFFFFKF